MDLFRPNANLRRAAALFVALAAVLLLLIGAGSWRFYEIRKRRVLDAAAVNLDALAQLKAEAIDAEIRAHVRDATVVASNPFLLRSVATFLSTGRGRNDVCEWLRELRDIEGYEMVTLATPAGEIRLSTATSTSGFSPHLHAIWSDALRGGGPAYLTRAHRYAPGRPVHYDLIAPLRADGRVLGALVFRNELSSMPDWLRFLPPTIPSGRVALLWRDGDAAALVAAAPIQSRARVPLSSGTVEAGSVLRAGPVREGVDANGTPVVAAAAPIGGTGLVLFIAQAQRDILDPLAADVRYRAASLALLAACVPLAGVAVWKRRRERRARDEQEILADSERRLRELIESIPGGVWLCDAAGVTTYISPQLSELLHLSLSRAVSDGWWTVIHPDDQENATRIFLTALEDHAPFELVFRVAAAGYPEGVLLGRATPRFSPDGEFQGFVGNVIDLTARHRAEEQVRQLSRAVEQSPTIVFITSTDSIIQYVNPRFTQATGYTAAEVLGHDPSLLRAFEMPADLYADVRATLLAGGEWRGELLNRRKDGEQFWVFCIASGIRDQDGVLTHFVIVQEDITSRKRAELELQRSADQIRRIVDANLIGTMVIEGDTIVEANAEFLRATGYTREDLRAGRVQWRSITPSEHLEISERAHSELARTGVIHPFEKEYFRKDGVRIPVLLGGTVIDLKPHREVCFMLDLTDVKRSEQEIQRMNGELRRLAAELLRSEDAERRRIARELHDSTAQLLTGIQLNLRRLEPALDGQTDSRTILAQTGELARQCTGEIRAISYAMHPPLLDDLGLSAAIDMLARGYQERTGIEVALDIPRGLARFDRDLELALFRIVQEALTNVQRHSGSTRAAIRLHHCPEGLLLEVEDEGAGFRDGPDQIGVGLLGMRERAKQFGGEMSLLSAPTGAILRVTLPL